MTLKIFHKSLAGRKIALEISQISHTQIMFLSTADAHRNTFSNFKSDVKWNFCRNIFTSNMNRILLIYGKYVFVHRHFYLLSWIVFSHHSSLYNRRFMALKAGICLVFFTKKKCEQKHNQLQSSKNLNIKPLKYCKVIIVPMIRWCLSIWNEDADHWVPCRWDFRWLCFVMCQLCATSDSNRLEWSKISINARAAIGINLSSRLWLSLLLFGYRNFLIFRRNLF